MYTNGIEILSGEIIKEVLKNKEEKIMSIIKEAYLLHYNNKTSLPQSTFLRFPKNKNNRIIALPSYIDGEKEIAGIKWISSFPDNIKKGVNRASALVVLNDMEDGRPMAVLEGSQISSNRTAASAALAAKYLHNDKDEKNIGLIGTGLINFTILKYIVVSFKNINTVYLYDLDSQRVNDFKEKIRREFGNRYNVVSCSSCEEIFNNSNLISFATTSSKPYIDNKELLRSNMTILHISLRDLSENIILNTNNIVDDVDHVCRAETSVHLTSKIIGNRNFINGVISECFINKDIHFDDTKATVFSPFGLGVLDLALAQYLYEEAKKEGELAVIQNFFV